jgi:PAS domain S-box-containing protein
MTASTSVLRHDRDVFQLLVESVEDHALVALDADGRVVTWNHGAERIGQFHAHEIIGRSHALIFTPEDQARGWPEEILRRAASAGRFSDEGLRLRKDRTSYRASVVVSALRGDAGGAQGFAMVLHDVTEQRVAEVALRESEMRFRTMADGAPVLLWMTGTDGLCSFFNEGWLRFTGRPLGRELGNGWAEGVHPEDFADCMDIFLTAFVARQSFAMEYRLRRSDGQYRWIYDQGAPRFAPDGTFAGFIGSCIDVSEQKEARRALAQRSEALAAALREREVLLQEVHHRVKNNLQLVSSLLNMQGRHIVDPGALEALHECQGRVQTIAAVHDLLDQASDLSRVPLSAYARGLVAAIVHASGVSPGLVHLELDVAEVTLPVAIAVPCGLILNELITNALKHAFPGGRQGCLRVALRAIGEGQLELTVQDNGVGLPHEFSDQDSDSLGLTLVATLAQQIEAKLDVERNGGTTFRMAFSDGGMA